MKKWLDRRSLLRSGPKSRIYTRREYQPHEWRWCRNDPSEQDRLRELYENIMRPQRLSIEDPLK